MLFNSPEFLLQFLPVVFLGFLLLHLVNLQRCAVLWLIVASLVFYGWWSWNNLPLIIGSVLFNYALGGLLMRRPNRALLVFGITANVLLLAVFKYTGFLAQTVRDISGVDVPIPTFVLPLALSFFTFQQIAYLVVAYDGAVPDRKFLSYCLFIVFFPHLIAGPITQPREMLPQFSDHERFRPRLDFVALGSTIFLVGLFKKVVIADPFGAYAAPVFVAAREGGVQAFEAWGGALAYTLQMYFDFSGYSDMAIGLGLLFGISLPLNFNSPYKARNVIEYWSRWHMTLTRFLTAHIYNPIVMSITRKRMTKGLPLPKRGRMTTGTFAALVAFPTLFTMLVSGVWHGAGWQFVVFGLLHGVFLIIAHAWRQWKVRRGLPLETTSLWRNGGAVLLTFFCAMIALVFFRADSVGTAVNLLQGMAGLNGVVFPQFVGLVPGGAEAIGALGLHMGELPLFDGWLFLRIVAFLVVVWAFPNLYQWLGDYREAIGVDVRPSGLVQRLSFARWRPSMVYGAVVGAFAVIAVLFSLSGAPSEFLYFQF